MLFCDYYKTVNTFLDLLLHAQVFSLQLMTTVFDHGHSHVHCVCLEDGACLTDRKLVTGFDNAALRVTGVHEPFLL